MEPVLLKTQAITLHRELLNQVGDVFGKPELPESKQVEMAVQHSTDAIYRLYGMLQEHVFLSLLDEVFFFKTVKPLFTSEREYYQRLYHALLFGEENRLYWERELKRMNKLLAEHQDFVNYYHNNDTHHDAHWFIQGQAPIPCNLCMAPWETNPVHTSQRDNWVAGLLAVERYKDWVAFKINSFAV